MIKAKSIMTENVATIKENATISEAANFLTKEHVSSLLVLKNNAPVAVVTENDLIKGHVNRKSKVKDIMNKNFLVIGPEVNYSFIVRKLRHDNIKRFPVVQDKKLVGIITETDVVDATRDFTRFHQIMQEIILAVFGLVTAFFLFFFSPLGQFIRKGLIWQ
jgi:CBS domain-containing protein